MKLSRKIVFPCLLCILFRMSLSATTTVMSTTTDRGTSDLTTTIMSTTTARGTSDRMCYGCADSTNKEGSNDCQVNTEEMMVEAGERLDQLPTTASKSQEKHLENIDYIKDCSKIGPGYGYCMIAVVEKAGEVSSYIRDCSNGSNPFPSNVQILLIPDNQTHYAIIGETVYYVMLCNKNYCNGPKPAHAPSLEHNQIATLSVLIVGELALNLMR